MNSSDGIEASERAPQPPDRQTLRGETRRSLLRSPRNGVESNVNKLPRSALITPYESNEKSPEENETKIHPIDSRASRKLFEHDLNLSLSNYYEGA
jgi:hypothetical protein